MLLKIDGDDDGIAAAIIIIIIILLKIMEVWKISIEINFFYGIITLPIIQNVLIRLTTFFSKY